MQYKEIKSQNLTANFSVTYSSDTYEDREYTMTVRVYEMFTIFRNEIAKGTISYRITRSLNGHLVAVQNGTERASRQGRATIQAAVNTDFQVRMHDPSGKICGGGCSMMMMMYGTLTSLDFLLRFSERC